LQELKRHQEEEEARLEEQRLAAEQARLAAQFHSEQEAQRARANGHASKAGGSEGGTQQQQHASMAGTVARPAGEDPLSASKSEGRRRTSGAHCSS
jgi:hypothetical protein